MQVWLGKGTGVEVVTGLPLTGVRVLLAVGVTVGVALPTGVKPVFVTVKVAEGEGVRDGVTVALKVGVTLRVELGVTVALKVGVMLRVELGVMVEL